MPGHVGILGVAAGGGGITDPLDIANCGLWLDADDASTFTLSGSVVQQWRDKSGNSNHFSQTLGNPTRTGTMNGLTTVSYAPDVANQRCAGLSLGNNCTLFAVVYHPSGTGWGLLDTAPSAANTWRAYGSSGLDWEIHNQNPKVAISGPDDAATVLTCRVSIPANRKIERWVDGGNYATANGSSSTSIAWSTPTIGAINTVAGINAFRGEIAEFIIYSAALSDGDRALVENYLSAKWGTP